MIPFMDWLLAKVLVYSGIFVIWFGLAFSAMLIAWGFSILAVMFAPWFGNVGTLMLVSALAAAIVLTIVSIRNGGYL